MKIPSPDDEGEEGWMQEMQDFESNVSACYWSYINNLYIYPESVVMSAHNKKVKVTI